MAKKLRSLRLDDDEYDFVRDTLKQYRQGRRVDIVYKKLLAIEQKVDTLLDRRVSTNEEFVAISGKEE